MEQKIYYKSDFTFVLVVSDEDRPDIGWPDFDWTARFFTQTPAISFTASCVGGECVNCYNDNGHIRIVAKDHHLSAGTLRVDFTGKLEDGRFPDCIRKEVSAAILDGVSLTTDRKVGMVVLRGATGDGGNSSSGSGGGNSYIDRRIRKGFMPFKARPGILYQNKGVVKVSYKHWAPIGESRIVSDTVRVFDLTNFFPVIGFTPDVKLYGYAVANVTKEEFDAHVHWDREKRLLTLDNGTENPKNTSGFFNDRTVLIMKYYNEMSPNYNEVAYINKDKQCEIEKSNRMAGIPFLHTLTQESAKNCVNKIVASYDNYYKEGWIEDKDINIGCMKAEVLRYRNTHKVGGDMFGNDFRRFFHWRRISKEQHTKEYRVNKCKLYKVRYRTKKGYTSNAIRVSVAMQKGQSSTGDLKYHLVALD